MDSLNDPRMLLSATTIAELEQNFDAIGEDGPPAGRDTDRCARAAYMFGAITMVAAFLLILTIPTIDIEAEVEDTRAPAPVRKAAATD